MPTQIAAAFFSRVSPLRGSSVGIVEKRACTALGNKLQEALLNKMVMQWHYTRLASLYRARIWRDAYGRDAMLLDDIALA